MGVLDRITGPRDLRDLTDTELDELASSPAPGATSAPTSAWWS